MTQILLDVYSTHLPLRAEDRLRLLAVWYAGGKGSFTMQHVRVPGRLKRRNRRCQIASAGLIQVARPTTKQTDVFGPRRDTLSPPASRGGPTGWAVDSILSLPKRAQSHLMF